MRISIVVPAFNEERILGETLHWIQSLYLAFLWRRWAIELIVCDNNSTDRTPDVARSEGATVVFEPINQIARARNRGARAATGDWLIFVDADSRPSAGLFEAVAGQIESGACVGGGATVSMDTTSSAAHAALYLWNLLSRSLHLVAGAFVFCQTSAFWEIGGFSNELFVCEDIDISLRLNRLAQAHGKRIEILERYPIVTSPRKLHLYTTGEYFCFVAKMLLSRGKSLKDQRACFGWYDGRR